MKENPLAYPKCRHFTYTDDTPGIDKLGLGIPAADYQRLGFAVLPLQRGGKRPHRMLGQEGGVHHASLTGAKVSEWWGTDPAANIGIATGRASGLLVIDLDVKAGVSGIESLRQFLRPPYDIPQACWGRTPSGGVHIWLRTPPDAPVPERPGILPGVDVKGDGGLVVAPPSMKLVSSINPGQPGDSTVPVPYRWEGGCPCQAVPAPEWVADWLAQARPGVDSSGQPAGESPDIETLIKQGAERGQRNDVLYRAACSLYRRHGTGSGAPQVAETIRAIWQAGDTTGMPWGEVRTILDSARRFVMHQEINDSLLQEQTQRWLER